MTRVLYCLVALALAFGLYGLWGKSRAEGSADGWEHRADSLALVVRLREAQRQKDSIESIAKIERAVNSRDSAITVARRAGDRVPNLVTRVIEVAGDSAEVVATVAELEEAHSVEVSALRGALAFSDSIIAAKDIQLRGLYSSNQALRTALEASRMEAVAWEKMAKPRILGIRVSPSLAFSVGLVIGAAAVVLR